MLILLLFLPIFTSICFYYNLFVLMWLPLLLALQARDVCAPSYSPYHLYISLIVLLVVVLFLATVLSPVAIVLIFSIALRVHLWFSLITTGGEESFGDATMYLLLLSVLVSDIHLYFTYYIKKSFSGDMVTRKFRRRTFNTCFGSQCGANSLSLCSKLIFAAWNKPVSFQTQPCLISYGSCSRFFYFRFAFIITFF